MENIYKARTSKSIGILESFHEYQNEINQTLPDTNDSIQNLMKYQGGPDKFNALEESVSLAKLSHQEDVRVKSGERNNLKARRFNPKIPSELETYKRFSHLNSTKPGSRKFASMEELQNRFVTSKPLSSESDLKSLEDVIITVRVYSPYKIPPIRAQSKRGPRIPQFREEFQVLGSQFLSELRDKISCNCNKYHYFDISADPKQDLPEKDCDPGFFFITDTFYNDFRNPVNLDYSTVILNWAEKCQDVRTSKFQTKSMEETRFFDLTLSLGFPQVYQHHGNCEHLLIFSYIELLTPNHILCRRNYPLLKSFASPNAVLCNMCGRREYIFVVLNSNRQPQNPSYLCRQCFVRYNYVDGRKVGEFQAFRLNDYEMEAELGEDYIEIDDNYDGGDE